MKEMVESTLNLNSFSQEVESQMGHFMPSIDLVH